MSDPLLAANVVRVDDRGGPAVEQLTMATTGANVVVLGAPRALFEAACGLRDVTGGTLRVCGLGPREAVRTGAIASAPADVALPARWTVLDLASESARLAGHARKDSERLARAAVASLQIGAYANTRLGGLETSVKRAAVLSAALATGASALYVEDFTAGIQDGAARGLARAFVSACEGKRWVLFAGRLALSSPLGMNADEAVLFAGGRLVCSGNPAEVAARDRTFAVRTSGADAPAFAEKLRTRGARVESDDDARALTVTMPDDFTTHELVTLARASNVVVLELLPLSGALA